MRQFGKSHAGPGGACRGTTLLEIALMTVIIGVAIVAMMTFITSATAANSAMSEYPIGLSIARAGHEWARAQPPVELRDRFPILSVGVYAPFVPTNPAVLDVRSTVTDPRPLATSSEMQSAYAGWSQRFSMRKVIVERPNDTDPTGTSPAMEITVAAIKGGQAICSLKRVYYLN